MTTENRFLQMSRRLASSQSRFITSRQPYSTANFLAGCGHTRPYTPPPRTPADEQQRMNYAMYVGERIAGELFQECTTEEALARALGVVAEAAWYALQQMGATGNIPAPSGDSRTWLGINGQAIDNALVGRVSQGVRQAVGSAYRDRYEQAKRGESQAQSQSRWRDISPVEFAHPFGINNLSISESGINFIKQFEGFRANLYNDPVGHCTIGYGHLVHQGNCNGSESAEFKAGLTEARATELMRETLRPFEASVNVGTTVTLTQTQFDSLVSFSYNVGSVAFRGSTLLKLLNKGDYAAVPTELRKWINGGGKVLPGLVRRRDAEANLFTSGSYSTGQSYARHAYGGAFTDPNTTKLADIDDGEREDIGFGFAASTDVPAYCPINSATTASSTHFTMNEFDSHDGVATPVSVRGNIQFLMDQLEVLRAQVNAPIRIVSGYRSPAHNASVGGKGQSRHMCGQAADIQITGMTPTEVHATIERLITAGQMQQGGLGLYRTFVHYDTRGHKARW
ncbi:MAG TPA: D-Ala-D-Ala carboxypeptidase family metallohydrolase [Fibrella sp.]